MKARDNPFRTERVLQVRYRTRGETLGDLLVRLKQLGYRGAIVGRHGTGKTTLLEDLEVGLVALGFTAKRLRLDDTMRRFPPGFLNRFICELNQGDMVLFDGAEQMSRLEWQRFKLRSRKAGGLLITSHLRGMLPTLKGCSTSPELLDEIVGELLEADSVMLRALTAGLHEKYDGNLRSALRELYDVYSADDPINAAYKPHSHSLTGH